MTVKDFKEMIHRVLFCAGANLTALTPEYENVYLEVSKGKLVMAAWNILPFYRLGLASIDAEAEYSGNSAFFMKASFLWEFARSEKSIPLKFRGFSTLDELTFIREKRSHEAKPLWFSGAGNGNVYLNIGSSRLLIKRDAFHYYRNYEFTQLCYYPESFTEIFPVSFSVNRLSLLEALRMVSAIVSPQFSCMLYLELFPGRVVLRAFDFDDSAETEIPCDYSGEETRLTFEVKLFSEIIEHIESERIDIRFCLRDVDTAILPVYSPKPAKLQHDYFFILTQRIKWRET